SPECSWEFPRPDAETPPRNGRPLPSWARGPPSTGPRRISSTISRCSTGVWGAGPPSRLLLRGTQSDRHRGLFTVAVVLDLDLIIRAVVPQHRHELLPGVDPAPVEGDDHVPRFQTCFVRGPPGLDRFGVVLDDRPRARVARVDGDTKGGVLRLGAAPGVDDVVDHAFGVGGRDREPKADVALGRSEEHTSELQSRFDLVCRLLLEK